MEHTDFESLDPFATGNEIVQYEQSNPFFLPIEGSSFKYTKTKFIADEYKYVHILCLSNDFEPTLENKNKIKLFYSSDSDLDELYGQSKLITLLRAPFSLIHLQSIRSGLVSVPKHVLERFNNDCYQLENKELVYLMLEAKDEYVRSWIKLYECENNLDKFIQQKIFSSYYNLNDKKIEENLLTLIGQVADFKYWQDDRNCLLSINNAFNDRKFNLNFMQKWNLPTADIEKELQNLLQNFNDNKGKVIKNPAYPTDITNAKETEQKQNETDALQMKNYVDASKHDNRSFYEVTKPENLNIKPECIEELLIGHTLTEKEKYYLICNLLVSKNYCHYVLNNKNILLANNELFEKYKPIFQYLFGYAWITLYMEESIRKTRCKESDRFVFDIDTASALPVFPFAPHNPHTNPYFTCLVSDTLLNSTQNLNGVKQTIEYQNGIIDLKEFKRRLNIFVAGKSDKDLLVGANWSNMAITGGCMAGIMPKTNPLMMQFKKIADPKIPIADDELNRFYQEYYANSDVDIACNHSNILDFIDHVKHLKSVILQNLGDTVKENEIQIQPNKSLAIYINARILKEKCDRGEIPFKYDYIINNKAKRRVKFYFYKLYLKEKTRSNQKNEDILADKLDDDEFFELVDIAKLKKAVLIINDFSFESDIIESKKPEFNSGIEMVYIVKEHPDRPTITEGDLESESNIFIRFTENLKYKINSKHFKHSFEVFRIGEPHFFSCVARFHLPCVRSYYNGQTCYMLPSAISAYHTLTNIDFKYFVGSNDPISIINKYRQRGYSTILNKTEINQYLSYILAFPNHKKAYAITDTKEIKNIIGSLDVNHEFFRPRKNIPESFTVDTSIKLDYINTKPDYVNDYSDLMKFYKKKYPKYSSELLAKRSINEIGQVESLKRWMIDAAYDLLN